MHIIIDGYNLIGTAHRDLDSRRRELIRSLIQYRRVSGHDVTLVFDGHGGSSYRDTVKTEGGVRVVFSRIGTKADDVIKGMVKREKRFFVVVSSDREVADFAWSHGSVPVGSEEFLARLRQALRGEEKTAPSEMDDFTAKARLDEYEEEDRRVRKGSPRRLSKRRKAVMRALDKL